MIYPQGAPVTLNLRTHLPAHVVAVSANRDRSLIGVLTPQSLIILQSQSQLVLACISRPDDDIPLRGANEQLLWRYDSTAICVLTSNKHILIYSATTLENDEQRYTYIDASSSNRRTTAELYRQDARPAINEELKVLVRLGSPVKCCVQLGDELLICLADGWQHRLTWAGQVHDTLAVHLSTIPFTHTHDQQTANRAEYVTQQHNRTVYVVSAAYSPLIGGVSVVLNVGRAALLVSNAAQFAPDQLVAIWAQNMTDACVTVVNHRHRLVIGDIAAFHIDDANGTFVVVYRVKLTTTDIPDVPSTLGAVATIEWYPYGHVFAVAWQKRGVALFSTYGAQIWLDIGEKTVCSSIDWGAEGHQLWFVNNHTLQMYSTVRAANVNNPSMHRRVHCASAHTRSVRACTSRRLALIARAARVYGTRMAVAGRVCGGTCAHTCTQFVSSGGNGGERLVVAGTRGFAHCYLPSGKWSLFTNESHERDMVCTGGVAVWRAQCIVAAVFDVHAQSDQLRLYPVEKQLHNQHATTVALDSQSLMMCLRQDTLCLFDVHSRVRIYTIEQGEGQDRPPIVQRCAEIRCAELLPHPACVIDLLLTNMNHQSTGGMASASSVFTAQADSLLLNVEGRLMLLTPAHSKLTTNDDQLHSYELQPPLVVASCVEQMWHRIDSQSESAHAQPHLVQALWLSTGCRGIRVWMPLFPSGASLNTSLASGSDFAKHHQNATATSDRAQFISKRIMLPFELDVCPILICAGECVAIGIDASEATPERRTQLFLHHLLRQLLKRNLGLYALQIAATCRHLPYFSHSLELLLHQVLDEEATTSEPIPDPLLPRVIAFIQEFPEYLQTIAHCARKTELALWRQLFTYAGSPKDLFEMCLKDGHLQTAASYLIILQNMEANDYSKQQASCLLEAVLRAGEWSIARDICRFMRAIDPADLDSPVWVNTPALKQQTQQQQHKTSVATMVARPLTQHDNDAAFVYPPHLPNLSRHRLSSASAIPTSPPYTQGTNGATSGAAVSPTPSSGNQTWKAAARTPPSLNAVNRRSPLHELCDDESVTSSEMHMHLMLLLTKHARHLLHTCQLRHLGTFAAHLDFHLVLFLQRERLRAGRIVNAVRALTSLHDQFDWPLPLLSHAVVDALSRRLTSSASINGGTNGVRGLSRPTSLTVITRGGKGTTASVDSGFDTYTTTDSIDHTVHLLMQQQRELAEEKRASMVAATATVPPAVQVVTKTVHLEAASTNAPLNVGTSPSCSLAGDVQSPMSIGVADGQDWMYSHHLANSSVTAPRMVDSNGNSTHASVQLRYIQQLMLEAGCTEWSLVLCILLRDMVGLGRALQRATHEGEDGDERERLLLLLHQLNQWADEKCPGYTPLLTLVRGHVHAMMSTTNGSIISKSSSTSSPAENGMTYAPITVTTALQNAPCEMSSVSQVDVVSATANMNTPQDEAAAVGNCAIS